MGKPKLWTAHCQWCCELFLRRTWNYGKKTCLMWNLHITGQYTRPLNFVHLRLYMVSNLLLPSIFCLCLFRNMWILMQAREQNLSRMFMIELEQILRRWPRCMRSAPTGVARRCYLNQEIWFGCTYARIALLKNARASCSPEQMVHSKCFARSMTMHIKLIFQILMVWAQVSMSPIFLHSMDWWVEDNSFSRGGWWWGHSNRAWYFKCQKFTIQHQRYKSRATYKMSCQETTRAGEFIPNRLCFYDF